MGRGLTKDLAKTDVRGITVVNVVTALLLGHADGRLVAGVDAGVEVDGELLKLTRHSRLGLDGANHLDDWFWLLERWMSEEDKRSRDCVECVKVEVATVVRSDWILEEREEEEDGWKDETLYLCLRTTRSKQNGSGYIT